MFFGQAGRDLVLINFSPALILYIISTVTLGKALRVIFSWQSRREANAETVQTTSMRANKTNNARTWSSCTIANHGASNANTIRLTTLTNVKESMFNEFRKTCMRAVNRQLGFRAEGL